ncbi:MAG: Rv3654c family TadE-like protein [Acidimicrobiia bacterium]
MGRNERGSASVVLLAVVALALLVAVGIANLGLVSVGAQRAQRAADLAALAGATRLSTDTPASACAIAEAFAQANGAHLLSCQVRGWALRVRVHYGFVTRSAAAALSAVP